jgi:diguanylate cyclase
MKVGRGHSTVRLFLAFAVITLIAVLVLGFVLAASYRSEANRRGIAEGRSEAMLMAETGVQPLLGGAPLSRGLTAPETAAMHRLVATAVGGGHVLRLRLRDLSGQVVFSNDSSEIRQRPESEALDAARGSVVTRLTRLNADSVDTGRVGATSVEVYLPLQAGTPPHRVGVLEVYLPYAPISADVTAGLGLLYRNLAVGLAILYLVLFAIAVSVGRRLRRQARINAHLAEYDPLTHLPNRALFHRRVEAALLLGSERGQSTTVAIIDLDRFKEVNDTLGHYNGDRLLTALSDRMASHLRGLDALARLGGDEFGILLANVSEPEQILDRLRDVIEHEVNIGGLPVAVEASIGYVVAPDHGSDVDDLLQLADVAMYVAKGNHAGVVRYDPSQNHYDAANLSLVAELRQAIDSDQLVLHYQPKVHVDTQRIASVEALVRWEHPTQGLLYPDRFIPLAEQTGLIDRLTEWVVAQALADLGSYCTASDDLTVAVNISARNLGHIDFADKMVAALERAGVAPDRLYVEVTETALMTDPDSAATVLEALSRIGVRVSIDDFGTGQTSLSYLSTLPIHELKVDRSFIADMTEHASHAAIVRSIVELGHNLGFQVVGEGVETADILDALAATGCELVQGYFFARPMPLPGLRAWITQHDARVGHSSSPR